jgi:hypothetical protein
MRYQVEATLRVNIHFEVEADNIDDARDLASWIHEKRDLRDLLGPGPWLNSIKVDEIEEIEQCPSS